MKRGRKLLSILLTLTMVLGLFCGATAHAAANDVELKTEKSGDTVLVKLVAKTDMEFGGLALNYSFDEEVFSFVDGTSPVGEPTVNPDTKFFGVDTQTKADVAAGETIVTLTFRVGDGFEKNKDYPFSVDIQEAYNAGLDDYDWAEKTFEATYREDEELPPVEGSKVVDLSKVVITKNVTGDENPEETFTFNLTATKVEPENGAVSLSDAPKIGPLTVKIAAGAKSGTVTLPAEVEFPLGGVYTYEVTEQDNGTENWTYDTTKYYLVLEVEENADGDLVLDTVAVHKGSQTGEKSEIVFENEYEKPVELASLTVTKAVVGEDGNPMNGEKTFPFAITFDQDFTGKIGDDEVAFKAGEAYKFELADQGELKIENIPVGAKYTLVETGTEYYTGSAAVTVGGEAQAPVEGKYKEDLKVESEVAAGANSVAVTNTYSITPPTGVAIHGEMLVVLALAVLALVGGFVLNRKLRRA